MASGQYSPVRPSRSVRKRLVLIDSGSVSNLMGMNDYEELKAQGLNAKIQHCYKRLHEYDGKELEVICQVQVEISVGDKKVNSQFVVIKSGRCLLGHATSKALGLLRIGPGAGAGFECKDVGEKYREFLTLLPSLRITS